LKRSITHVRQNDDVPPQQRSRASTPDAPELCGPGFPGFQDCTFFHTPLPLNGKLLHNVTKAEKAKKKLYYFPARAICLLQPHRGTVLLPLGDKDLVEFWRFMAQELALDQAQVQWFQPSEKDPLCLESGLNSDTEALSIVPQLSKRWIPYAERPQFSALAQQLAIDVVADTREWKLSVGHKGILHPRPGDADSISLLDKLLPGVAKPRGFLCSCVAELVSAAEQLCMDGVTDVLIKPVMGSDGEGIEFHSITANFSHYDFPMGDVVLEEKLELDLNPDGTILSVVTHFFGDQLFGECCDQLLKDATNFQGTVVPSLASSDQCAECERIAKEVISVLRPQGPGGFDFLFVHGKPYLTDINCGRFNGGHYPKAFHMQFALRGTAFVAFKHVPKCSIDELWSELRSNQLHFEALVETDTGTLESERCHSNPDRRGRVGIFPLVHLPDCFGSYIAIGQTAETCMQLQQKFLDMDL
jgi:hypothetical protein